MKSSPVCDQNIALESLWNVCEVFIEDNLPFSTIDRF